MVYNEKLADRIRKTLGKSKGVTEKHMFGGLSFLVNGKMFCGVLKNEMVVRINPKQYEEFLNKPHVRPMDFTGKPMKGFLFVDHHGIKNDNAIKQWVQISLNYAKSLLKK